MPAKTTIGKIVQSLVVEPFDLIPKVVSESVKPIKNVVQVGTNVVTYPGRQVAGLTDTLTNACGCSGPSSGQSGLGEVIRKVTVQPFEQIPKLVSDSVSPLNTTVGTLTGLLTFPGRQAVKITDSLAGICGI